MKITIKRIGINGEGIGYFKRKPVFIAGAYTDEIVECSLIDQGRYFIGHIEKIIRYSHDRKRSECPYHMECGSCVFMDLAYEKQLEYKKEILKESLYRYASINMDVEITGSDKTKGYRNKCSMPIVKDKDGILHSVLYKAGSNHPVFIDRCLIHDEMLEDIRIRVMEVLNRYDLKAYEYKNRSGIRHLMIRGFSEEYQLVLITGNDRLDKKMIDELSRIDKLVSIYQDVNTAKDFIPSIFNKPVLLSGKDKISLRLDEHEALLSPSSFYQLNHEQALNIYSDIKKHVSDSALLVEAYSGIGTISLYVADKAEKVISIELNKDAIEDGKDNAKLNDIRNIEYISGDASKVIADITAKYRIDTLIVDPPRVGIDDRLIRSIIKNKVQNIIYVSCNPVTLAKNLKELLRYYEIDYIRAYDMFPNTPHVETVCLMSRVEGK